MLAKVDGTHHRLLFFFCESGIKTAGISDSGENRVSQHRRNRIVNELHCVMENLVSHVAGNAYAVKRRLLLPDLEKLEIQTSANCQ